MRRQPELALLALLSVLGCRAVSRQVGVSASERPRAVIERDSAWFIFPREPDSVFAWNVPGTRQFSHAPERIWTVQIAPYAVNEIFELTVRQEWRNDGRAHVASLAAIVRGSSVSAGRAMYDCVCTASEEDPAIRAHVTDQRVRIVVYGKAAIARWLSGVQDTVQFTRLEADTSGQHAVRTMSQHAVVVRRALQ
jgi:hypothetical protein